MKTITCNGYSFLIDETGLGYYWLDMEKGTWEPWTFRLFDRFLHKDTIYIDLGAWMGMTVLYASKLCDRCYAFEPDPVAYGILRVNIDANNAGNIKTFNEAIANHDGTLSLGNEHHSLGNAVTRIGTDVDSFQVSCRTLETFFIQEKIDGPSFIKMDVEGSEEVILKDMGFFERHKPILYLSTHTPWFKNQDEGVETIARVRSLYKYCLHNDMWEIEVKRGAMGYGGLIFTDNL
jgi:FkbM family methyltransferase